MSKSSDMVGLMAWTWAQIERLWLGTDGQPEPAGFAEAFNRISSVLGDGWTTPDLQQIGPPGPWQLMNVILVGIKLEGLNGVADTDSLVARLRRRDRDAWAELSAIRIARGPLNEGEVELGPIVMVGTRNRRPDFRIRDSHDGDWTYVEVTAPTDSVERTRLSALLEQISAELSDEETSSVLEAILRREPNENERSEVVQTLRRLGRTTSKETVHLGNELGIVLANHTEARTVILEERGEPHTSRLGLSRAQIRADGTSSTLTLRIAYRDERAARLLDAEARQLSRETPNVVMISMGEVVSTRGEWERMVLNRYQPRIHTRISGTCLFASAVLPQAEQVEARIANRFIPNPHALKPIARGFSQT